MINLFYYLLAKYRIWKNKEDPLRVNERFGISSIYTNKKKVLWFHAASVGEVLSIIELLKTIEKLFPKKQILLTTTTVSGQSVAKKHLSNNIFFQYMPYDSPKFIKRFLNFWQIEHLFLIESEIWPVLLFHLKKKCLISILNARISNKSFKRWKSILPVAKKIFSCINHVFSPSIDIQKKFQMLGVKKLSLMPPLKLFSKPLAYQKEKLKNIKNSRPKWLAVSTHEGEEEICLQIHQKSQINKLQTWIAPRHINRKNDIYNITQKKGLSVCFFSNYQENTDVVIIDCIGKMGLFFALCPIVLVGGSFIKRGGHNPLEPLMHGCQTIYGSDMSNFLDILPFLPENNMCYSLDDAVYFLRSFPQSHKTPFVYQESIDGYAKKILSDLI